MNTQKQSFVELPLRVLPSAHSDNSPADSTAHTLLALDKAKADNARFKAKLQLLQKQCELLEQIMSEHELNSPVYVMDNLSAQITQSHDRSGSR